MQDKQPLNDDDDLAKRTRSDDFWIHRIFKFALLGCSVVLMLGLTVLLFYKLSTDGQFRNDLADSIKNNGTSIIIGVTAILGVNLKGSKMGTR